MITLPKGVTLSEKRMDRDKQYVKVQLEVNGVQKCVYVPTEKYCGIQEITPCNASSSAKEPSPLVITDSSSEDGSSDSPINLSILQNGTKAKFSDIRLKKILEKCPVAEQGKLPTNKITVITPKKLPLKRKHRDKWAFEHLLSKQHIKSTYTRPSNRPRETKFILPIASTHPTPIRPKEPYFPIALLGQNGVTTSLTQSKYPTMSFKQGSSVVTPWLTRTSHTSTVQPPAILPSYSTINQGVVSLMQNQQPSVYRDQVSAAPLPAVPQPQGQRPIHHVFTNNPPAMPQVQSTFLSRNENQLLPLNSHGTNLQQVFNSLNGQRPNQCNDIQFASQFHPVNHNHTNMHDHLCLVPNQGKTIQNMANSSTNAHNHPTVPLPFNGVSNGHASQIVPQNFTGIVSGYSHPILQQSVFGGVSGTSHLPEQHQIQSHNSNNVPSIFTRREIQGVDPNQARVQTRTAPDAHTLPLQTHISNVLCHGITVPQNSTILQSPRYPNSAQSCNNEVMDLSMKRNISPKSQTIRPTPLKVNTLQMLRPHCNDRDIMEPLQKKIKNIAISEKGEACHVLNDRYTLIKSKNYSEKEKPQVIAKKNPIIVIPGYIGKSKKHVVQSSKNPAIFESKSAPIINFVPTIPLLEFGLSQCISTPEKSIEQRTLMTNQFPPIHENSNYLKDKTSKRTPYKKFKVKLKRTSNKGSNKISSRMTSPEANTRGRLVRTDSESSLQSLTDFATSIFTAISEIKKSASGIVESGNTPKKRVELMDSSNGILANGKMQEKIIELIDSANGIVANGKTQEKSVEVKDKATGIVANGKTQEKRVEVKDNVNRIVANVKMQEKGAEIKDSACGIVEVIERIKEKSKENRELSAGKTNETTDANEKTPDQNQNGCPDEKMDESPDEKINDGDKAEETDNDNEDGEDLTDIISFVSPREFDYAPFLWYDSGDEERDLKSELREIEIVKNGRYVNDCNVHLLNTIIKPCKVVLRRVDEIDVE